ncbi:hypothetical protein BJY01DRAFT_219147 [Aspergillus pseudoustus]|uniref:Uncharacterized protein n=1 Tax=Aspergillus pseudoustus TaxID=1810923 RepID=A0ABR4JIA5_9EURO
MNKQTNRFWEDRKPKQPHTINMAPLSPVVMQWITDATRTMMVWAASPTTRATEDDVSPRETPTAEKNPNIVHDPSPLATLSGHSPRPTTQKESHLSYDPNSYSNGSLKRSANPRRLGPREIALDSERCRTS